MKRPFSFLALGASLLAPLAHALNPSEIPSDTPISQLIKTANAQLAAGNSQDALSYFDAAVSRDPSNYLNIFKRGAAYLSLGKSLQAQRDFDKVLELKPGFEGALVQRAKIRARNGDWDAAKHDYLAAGKAGGQELADLEEAQGAAIVAQEAADKGNWEECVQQAGVAVLTAGALLDLRKLRARCRFEKGEVAEGISDLQHILQLSTGDTAPHIQVSALSFYSLGEADKGLAQIRKCLQSDPDSKDCRKLFRREKALDKDLKKMQQAVEKRQFATAAKMLIGKGEEEPGLLAQVKEDVHTLKEEGTIHQNTPEGLYGSLVEQTCEAYTEMNNPKRAEKYCTEALTLNSKSLHGLLFRAKSEIERESFEAAIATLNEAKEAHGGVPKIQKLLEEAHTLLKRSKTKDYYKVLGVSRDADDREIKRAWRKLTMQFHPDKASVHGLNKDEAEKKMAAINEAYEVLKDPELKERFDRGDDPNDPNQQGTPFQGSPFGGQQFVFRSGPGGGFPGGGSFQFPQGFGF